MTIPHYHCPRCSKPWDHEEFPAQICFRCNYPDTPLHESEHAAREAVEGYAWWPRLDVPRPTAELVGKTDKRAA